MAEEDNAILGATWEVFYLVTDYAEVRPDALLGESFEHRLLEAWQLCHQQLKSLVLGQTTLEIAVYALVAFIDERVMQSSWACRYHWANQPLQVLHFGEQLAGEGFFTRLKQLLGEPASPVVLLKLYGICLHFGFKGQYACVQHPERKRLKKKLFEKISEVFDEPVLAPCDRGLKDKKKITSWSMVILWSVGFGIAVTLSIYLLMVVSVQDYSRRVGREMHHSAQGLHSALFDPLLLVKKQ